MTTRARAGTPSVTTADDAGQWSAAGEGFRVLTAEMSHETNSFSRQATDAQAFRDRYVLVGGDAVAERGQANTELAGFLDVGRARGWQVTHVLSAAAGPSGKVQRAAFNWLCDPIVSAVTRRPFDGLLLGLHGAMDLDFCEDGEGELLRRLRHVVGLQMPIAITLDPHANVSRQMCALADIVVSFTTYPHIDMRETGRRAADILHRTMAGEIRPRTVRVSCPMLEEVNGGRTDVGPMIERLASARAYEQRADVFAVSINAGFAGADVIEVGPTVLVTGQGDQAAHTAFADTIADDIWNRRHHVLNDYLSVEAAAAVAVAYVPTDGPLVVERQLRPERRAAGRWHRDPGGDHAASDTRPAAVRDLWHRPSREAGGGAEIDATLPRRLRSDCRTGDRVRQRRAVQPAIRSAALPACAKTDLPSRSRCHRKS